MGFQPKIDRQTDRLAKYVLFGVPKEINNIVWKGMLHLRFIRECNMPFCIPSPPGG